MVTARKREESAQDIPVLITAISQARIDRLDLTSLEKVAASTPQFNVGRGASGSGAQITLRGIGAAYTSIGIEQSTAIIVDGVYYGYGHVINEGFFDLARVELLKGPQVLFFGKNATAGVVSITTADPTDELEIMARSAYEFESENLILESHVAGPIGNTLSGRLAVRVSDMADGYFENHATPISIDLLDIATGTMNSYLQQPNRGGSPGRNEKIVRGTLKWMPDNAWTATLKLSAARTEDESNAWNYVPFACPTGVSQVNPDVPCKRNFDVYTPNAPSGMVGAWPGQNSDGSAYNLYEAYGATGVINYAADNFSVNSTTNYNWHRNRWGLGLNVHSAVHYVHGTEDTSLDAWSNETRIQTSFAGPFNGMVGVYYQQAKREFYQPSAFGPLEDSSQPLELRYLAILKDSETKGETISAFGQLTWSGVPDVEIAGGVRFTHETKDSYLVMPYANAGLSGLFIQDRRITGDQTFENWSPEATVTWQPSDAITVYGAYKTGFKSGGFSASSTITAPTVPEDVMFAPEKARGVEGGLKTLLLDRQLRFNVGAYSYEYTNLQVDYFNSSTFQFITTNAGSVRAQGAEIDAEYAPLAVDGLTLRGALNYNRTRYRNYIAPCYGGQSIAAGCDTEFQGGPGQDLSGKPTAVSPLWTASLSGEYERAIGAGLVFGITVDARYSDSYLGSSFAAPLSRQDDYVNLDAGLRLRTDDGRWELALFGRNLTNEFSISGVLDLPNTGSGTGTADALAADQIGLVNLPRTFRAQLTWRF